MSYERRSLTADNVRELARDVTRELESIEQAFTEFETIRLKVLNAAPARPRNGMIALADGTNWNPGGLGAGFYGYYGGAWNRLG